MTTTPRASVKVPAGTKNRSDATITQVTVVVADLDAAIAQYSTTFNWGPWAVYDFRDLDHRDVTVHGRPGGYDVRVAITTVGGVDIQLLEPLGPSPYQDALARHPGSLHHIQVDSATVPLAQRLGAAGLDPILSGRFEPGSRTAFGYTIFDARSRAQVVLGSRTGDVVAITALPHRIAEVRDGVVTYTDADGAAARARTSTIDVVQVGMVVESIDETMRGLRDLLGWGPWRVYDFREVAHTNTTYRGAPFDYAMRIATVRAGGVHVELIEPTGPGPYRDFLDERGPGPHHLQVCGNDPEEARTALENAGMSVQMAGHVGLEGSAGLDYVLYEDPRFGHLVEITQGDRSRLLATLPYTEQH